MIKRLFKTMVALLAIAAAATGPVRGQNASPDVTLDFTINTWGLPTSNTMTTESYTDGTYSITLSATYAYKFTSGYLLLGKSGSYLQLPSFSSPVEKIEVVGNSGASTQVVQNIYVGETAVSTQTTGATGTKTYVINADYRAAGNIYTLKVGSAHNTQITYIKVYYVSSGGGSTPEPEPEPTKYTSAVAMSALQVGDTLAEGFSLTGNDANTINFVANRHKNNENLFGSLENISLEWIQSIGANCVFSTHPYNEDYTTTFAPVDENGRDGDAWVVTEVQSDAGFTDITIAGITIPVLYNLTFAEGTEDVGNWTITPAAATTGVTEGTVVTVKYNGTRRIKSIEAMVEGPSLTTPLTMEAITAGTIKITSPKEGMRYSKNGGTKTAITDNPTEITVAVGDKVAFYGNGTSITNYNGTRIAGGTADVNVYGNIMSLVNEEHFDTATTLTTEYQFYNLFRNNVLLKDASGLMLPATTLTRACYNSMFNGCTSLTTAPALPATTLAQSCYYGMFNGCDALTTAPALPATTLAPSCYTSMFDGCDALTTAPALPATELAQSCYSVMFRGCAALTTAPALPATTLANDCYSYMFYNCTSLTTAPELPAQTLVSSCYKSMFYNCRNLSSVTCLATSGINQNSSTDNWLNNAGTEVEGTKTVNAVSTANWPTNDVNGIPSGWTRQNIDN